MALPAEIAGLLCIPILKGTVQFPQSMTRIDTIRGVPFMNGTQVCYPIEAMDDLLLTCACGGLTPVSSYAIGQNTKCANCGAVLTITEMNIRPRTEPKREIGPPEDDEEEVKDE
jgi:hypothetical protein